MNNVILKDTLREIRRNAGRFLSVLLIAALGCGFFSGVKATKPDMTGTAAEYFREYKLMDLKLTSAIGVRSPDVEAVKMAENVRGAHAAYSKDVFYYHKNRNLVLKCISFNSSLDDSSPNLMNKLNVVEGRLPENDGECAVEIKISSPDTFRIGEKLRLTDPDSTKKLTDTLENDEFEIVGIVTSPQYIGFERDATTEGDGTIVSNIFLREEEFITSYYTEMFVDLEGLDEEDPFSEEYRKSVEKQGAAAKAAFEESVNARFEDLREQAQSKINSAQSTADTLQEFVSMDYDELKAKYPDILKTAKRATEAYEKNLEDGRDTLLEKSAMLRAKKALSIAKELMDDGNDPNGEGHKKYQAELDEAYSRIKEAEGELAQASAAAPEIYCFDRFEASSDYSSFEGDSRKIDYISRVFPVFFILVAALVCLTTMSRLIEEQRGSIGVLKALGYTDGEILAKYLVYSGTAALLGGVGGSVIGLVIFPRMIYNGYKMLYNIPRLQTPMRPVYIAGSALAAVICICGVTAYTCLRELREVPGSLMRPKPPRAGKRILLEKLPALWEKFSFMGKVTTRNMFRYKRRFFMTLVGVAGCTALIITGFGLKHSISSVVDKQFGDVFAYDCIAVLNGRYTYDELEDTMNSMDGIDSHMQTMLTEYEVSYDEGTYSTSICVPENVDRLEEYVKLRSTDEGSKLFPEKGGVVLTNKLAKLLGAETGSTVTLSDPDGNSAEFRVDGVCVNYAFHYAFMSADTYEEGYGRAPKFNVSFIGLQSGTVLEDFRVRFLENDCFYGLTTKDDQCEGFLNSVDSLNTVVAVLIVSAGLLAAVVLYDLASINITERLREIATVKVLGFFDSETDDYILRENLISAAIGILAGLPVGKVLHYFVTVTAEVDIMMFNRELAGSALVWGAAITAVFTLLVDLALHFTLKKVDMIGSLKSVE
ncbi:FtsX-like permease family protein [Ruminococcus sp.]|uniref:ABC transporter permease n=1 Tax=Ruminococcus sp. TaxID=41978 RepID=UPI0025E78C0F|nr:FtsX-like permease family protein [Ruminococcus sp.]MBQ8965782.1 ABC transporter permease [Ruminococcus sp.]